MRTRRLVSPAAVVTALAASEITDTSLRLTWQGPMWGDFALFRVYRSQSGGVPPAAVRRTWKHES